MPSERRTAMSRISRSLTDKLTIGVVAVALSLYITTASILFLRSRYLIYQEAEKRANSVMNTALQQVRNHMNLVETAANANAWLAEKHFEPDSLMDVARRIVWLNRNTYACTIAAEPNTFKDYGRYFSVYSEIQGDSIDVYREEPYEYFDEMWYKLPVESGMSCWVNLYYENNKGQTDLDRMLAIYSRPIRQQGKTVGVVSTSLSFRKMAELIYSVDYPYPDAYFMILGNKGEYLLHPDTTKLFKKTIFSDQELSNNAKLIALGHEMTAGKTGTAELTIERRKCHVCFKPIPGTDWSLTLVFPTTAVLKNYHRMAMLVALFDILGLLLIIILARWGVHRALAPIGRLLEMARHMVDSQYDETMPQTSRMDAVGLLQNSFATMQQSIRARIDDIRSTTDEIKQSNVELIEATKLAEEALKRKTVFVQNVMHQIRTPLNIIQGFSQVLLSEVGRDAEGREVKTLSKEDFNDIAKRMKHNMGHLSRMILMMYNSSQAATSTESMIEKNDLVSCNKVAREAVEHTQQHFPNITIASNTELSDDVKIQTNCWFLMLTIRELLYNAAKFSDGKHITITVSQSDGGVHFTIEDVGPGMPPAYQQKMYEFFSKEDDLSEGLGLGLPLARRHAINLGGDLTLDSSYTQGCRFVVTMPAS